MRNLETNWLRLKKTYSTIEIIDQGRRKISHNNFTQHHPQQTIRNNLQ